MNVKKYLFFSDVYCYETDEGCRVLREDTELEKQKPRATFRSEAIEHLLDLKQGRHFGILEWTELPFPGEKRAA